MEIADYKNLICYINADKDFKWLNFNMSKDRQVELFLRGAQKALDFLQEFDWDAYKKIREVINKVPKSAIKPINTP